MEQTRRCCTGTHILKCPPQQKKTKALRGIQGFDAVLAALWLKSFGIWIRLVWMFSRWKPVSLFGKLSFGHLMQIAFCSQLWGKMRFVHSPESLLGLAMDIWQHICIKPVQRKACRKSNFKPFKRATKLMAVRRNILQRTHASGCGRRARIFHVLRRKCLSPRLRCCYPHETRGTAPSCWLTCWFHCATSGWVLRTHPCP